MSPQKVTHVLDGDQRLHEDTERGHHVIAAFGDRERAEQAARRLSESGAAGSVTVRIRHAGDQLSEAESFEEVHRTHFNRIRHALVGALLGAIVGAIVGGGLGGIATAAGWWPGRDAVIAAIGWAMALGWAGAVLFGFRSQWQLSYRDIAAGAAAIVTFDTDSEEAAAAAFALLRDAGAERVDRFAGELQFKYVAPAEDATVSGEGQLRS